MSRNKKFKNTYLITVEGKTTNGFISSVLHNLIKGVISAFGNQYSQVNTTFTVVDTEGDFNAKTEELNSPVDKPLT